VSEVPGLPDDFFAREDEAPDEDFYRDPRFTTHIDDATIVALTNYYREVLKPSDRVLDLMSSWISHLPNEIRYRHVAGLGMNEQELARNPRLDRYCVQNLNVTPVLPFEDDAFDAVLMAVSVQYLTRPFEVFGDIGRVLATGGKCIVSMSHRLFPTKAIYAFHVLPPADRCRLVGTYMHRSGRLTDIEVHDRSPANADPLWIVSGTRPPA
jgi:SAM-dependent methyltransferase